MATLWCSRVMIRLSSGRVTHVTDTPLWIMSLLPSTVSPTPIILFTRPSVSLSSPSSSCLPPCFIGGYLLPPPCTVCGGKWLPRGSLVSQRPSVMTGQPGSTLRPGNIRRGPAAPRGVSMTPVYGHSYRTAQRLDLCQVKQQVWADISCNLCVCVWSHCWWFSQPQQLLHDRMWPNTSSHMTQLNCMTGIGMLITEYIYISTLRKVIMVTLFLIAVLLRLFNQSN